MEQERKLQQDKRKQEREYLHKMMVENEKNKARMKGEELAGKVWGLGFTFARSLLAKCYAFRVRSLPARFGA